MTVLENVTVLLLREADQQKLVKTKWVKLVFFVAAYQYCKTNDQPFPELEFVKMPNGPAFRAYDEFLSQYEERQLLRIDRKPGFQMDITTVISKGSTDMVEEIDVNESLRESINSVSAFFKHKNTRWISDFSHSLNIWKKPAMWDKLSFTDLFDDDGIKAMQANASNIMEYIKSNL